MYILTPDGIFDGEKLTGIKFEKEKDKNYYNLYFEGGTIVKIDTKDTEPNYEKLIIIMKKIKTETGTIPITEIF